MNDKTFVRLKITSASISTEEFTKTIGLQPERSWRIGDQRPKTQIIEKENGWIFASGIEEDASLDEHLQELLSKLKPVSDRIAKIATVSSAEVSCAIYSERQPALSFSANIIHEFAALNAGLDIDVYILT